jgi:phage tail-like protein
MADAPQLVAAQAVAQREVRLAFDTPVLALVADELSFEALDAPAVPLQAVEILAEGTLVTVRVAPELTPDVRYRVSLLPAGETGPTGEAVFSGFRPARPAGRRFDLWSMLPKHNRRADDTGDLRRFVACLQEVTDLLLADADRYPDLLDIERAPDPFLDRILSDLGNPFAFDLTDIGKRRLASVLVAMYRQKGTAAGIRNAVRFFLGFEVVLVPHTSTTLVLGVSLLGVDWELGPSDRRALYTFEVRVPRELSATERSQLHALVDYLKPAHTHFLIVEPTAPVAWDHWVLAVSELGVTTDLH